MRLKNIKHAKEIILSSELVITNSREYKNKYHKLFNNDNPIHVEIGMGKGQFLIEKARTNPNINFIGIEKYDSVLVRAVQKIAEPFSNLKFIRADAEEITDIFSQEIDVIYLNFSDPWPKTRHEHRRLTSINFLKKYDKIFKNTNHIIMKTDNRGLFEYSVMSFVNYGYKIEKISTDLHKDDCDNILTEYEEKFSKKGQVIYMVDVIK